MMRLAVVNILISSQIFRLFAYLLICIPVYLGIKYAQKKFFERISQKFDEFTNDKLSETESEFFLYTAIILGISFFALPLTFFWGLFYFVNIPTDYQFYILLIGTPLLCMYFLKNNFSDFRTLLKKQECSHTIKKGRE